jgi:hypothetical protein
VSDAPSARPGTGVDERRAWGWVGHLLQGGTTPWLAWQDPGESHGRYLPGAQQLELLRRLNLAGPPSAELAGKVLDASAAGRGSPDLELVGVGRVSGFGPAPVDPRELPAGELVRVAASVLADQLVEAGHPAPAPARPSWWRRGYRLVGDPELADGLRAQLVARGRPPGGRQARVVVCGTDLGTMAAHVWTRRAFGEGVNTWREWLRSLRERREIPARADLLAVCRAWEQRVGKDRVHVVLDLDAVSDVVGERRPLRTPASLPAEGGELARRVGAVLGLLVLPDARASLLTGSLRPRVDAAVQASGLGRPLAVPPAHRDWLERAAEEMRRGIKRAGYAVHGDLDRLVPAWPERSDPAHAGPSTEATLDLAVRVLLDAGRDQTPGGRASDVDDRRTA